MTTKFGINYVFWKKNVVLLWSVLRAPILQVHLPLDLCICYFAFVNTLSVNTSFCLFRGSLCWYRNSKSILKFFCPVYELCWGHVSWDPFNIFMIWQVVFTEFTQLYPDFRNVMEAEKSTKQREFGKLKSVTTGIFYIESVKWQLPFNLSWKHQINSLNAKVAIV